MTRDGSIPLFLWIATATLVHLMLAGAADQVSSLLERKFAFRDFVAEVDARADSQEDPVEVSLLEAPQDPSAPDEAPPDPAEPESSRNPANLAKPEPEHAPTLEQEMEEARPVEVVEPPDEETRKRQKLELLEQNDRRIAVVQNVEDQNQEDNPEAEFIAEHANRVEEQTQARITSTDQNDPKPTPGGTHAGPIEFPGNSDETRIAQSEDTSGDSELAPDPVSHAEADPAREARLQPEAARPASQRAEQAARQPESFRPPPVARLPAAKPEAPRPLDAVTSNQGAFSVPSSRERNRDPKLSAQKPDRKAKPRPLDLLGLGASGTTDRGIHLNLTTQSALSAVGRDALECSQQRDARRRLSQHRGSWKSLGIERWRSAIENYVPTIKLGNTTALNAARNPFANYLNHIHNRIHPIFADTFLPSLDVLPSTHPLNDLDVKTFLEIVVRETDGWLVRMGVTRTSGITAFDIGALESVQRASPFGPAPSIIVSADGNVYLHWEFHRNPIYACSTYFARPYIMKTRVDTAPPAIEPPPARDPGSDEHSPPDPRQGMWDTLFDPPGHPLMPVRVRRLAMADWCDARSSGLFGGCMARPVL